MSKVAHLRGTALTADRSGAVLPMSAIALVTLAAMVGGGVDISRAYMVKNQLQNACDAGVLAGRRAVSNAGFDAAAEKQARAYFDTNFDQSAAGTSATVFAPVSAENGNRIDGIASTKMQTAVMQLFGYQDMSLAVTCSASMSVGNSDVIMVLDTTGSMDFALGSSTRLRALQDAMKAFYTTVNLASQGSNARVRYGFVPYSSSVNVGKLLYDSDPAYLVDSMNIQSRQAVTKKVNVQVADGWKDPVYTTGTGSGNYGGSAWVDLSGPYSKSNTCDNASPSNSNWSSNGSTTTTTSEVINGQGQKVVTTTTITPLKRIEYQCVEKTKKNFYVQKRTGTIDSYAHQYATSDPKFKTVTNEVFDHWVYKRVLYNTNNYKAFSSSTTPTGTDGSNETWTWKGCIEERNTTPASSFSFSKLVGMSPSGAADLDIDSAPDPSDDASKWRPMWQGIAYYRTSNSGYLTNSAESDYGAKAGTYCPQSARLLSVMNSSSFNAYADSLKAEGATYHDIGMIWGARLSSPTGIFAGNVTASPANGGAVARHIIFMTDGEMAPNYNIQSSYGIEWHDRRVTENGYSDQADRHNSRFLAVCAAAKAKGIRVWVIAFASGLTSSLSECASSDSSFTATNATQLNDAFQEIAKNVGELRVVQ